MKVILSLEILTMTKRFYATIYLFRYLKNFSRRLVVALKITANSSLNTLFDGTLILKVIKEIVVRRIRIEKKTTEAIKRIKVKSFNSFVITAIYEKLERDFKIKQICPF